MNAIEEMGKIIANIRSMELRKHDKLGSEEIFVRMVKGCQRPFPYPRRRTSRWT